MMTLNGKCGMRGKIQWQDFYITNLAKNVDQRTTSQSMMTDQAGASGATTGVDPEINAWVASDQEIQGILQHYRFLFQEPLPSLRLPPDGSFLSASQYQKLSN